MTSTTQTATTDAGTSYSWDVATAADVAGEYNSRDLEYALRAYSEVIRKAAKPADFVAAALESGPLGGSSTAQGRATYNKVLSERVTATARKAAEQAAASSLVKSDEMRAERHTESNRKAAERDAQCSEISADLDAGSPDPFSTEPADYTESTDSDD